jgi:hypothetical protein
MSCLVSKRCTPAPHEAVSGFFETEASLTQARTYLKIGCR